MNPGEEPEAEPPAWHPPVACPHCGQSGTRFVGRTYEMSVYVCEVCEAQFEVDEGEG